MGGGEAFIRLVHFHFLADFFSNSLLLSKCLWPDNRSFSIISIYLGTYICTLVELKLLLMYVVHRCETLNFVLRSAYTETFSCNLPSNDVVCPKIYTISLTCTQKDNHIVRDRGDWWLIFSIISLCLGTYFCNLIDLKLLLTYIGVNLWTLS